VAGTTLHFGRDGGVIHGLRATRPMDERLHITFHSDGTADGTFPVHVFDVDAETKTDVGGVRYEVTVLRPEAEPFAVDLAARRTKDGSVELSWPHAVHHRAYRILRSTEPEPGTGDEIGEFDAGEARETEAVRFIDPEGRGRRFYYSVVSMSDGGEKLSAAVTADSNVNE
jgi:hypothetical protein